MTDREERQHVIEVLKQMRLDYEDFWEENDTEEIKAFNYAIASIETDLKYDLLYEETSGQADKNDLGVSSGLDKNSKKLEKGTPKNDLGVDCIIRAEAIKCLECDFDITGKENMKTVVNYINSAHDKIVNLPSVTPQEPKTGHWIEEFNDLEGEVRFTCSSCGKYQLFGTDFCYHCGSDNREVEE